jgi:DNA polymerase-4
MPVRGERYHEISQRIMRILGSHTPLLEQVSVDEAYLDLTNWLPEGVTPETMARQLKAEILQETGLTCSVGVATGKGISKIASDLQKPDGLVIVPSGEEAVFLAPLAIGKLRGVGEATGKKLRELGIQTIGDLAKLPVEFLESKFGVHGRGLLALARGMDESPVVPEREAKSIGRETTYLTDVAQRDIQERTLLELSEDVGESLRRHGLLARGVTLKLRFGDFHTITRAMTLPEPADTTEAIYHAALTLLRQTNPTRAVRLIGVTSGSLQPAADRQLSLFADQPTEKDRKVADAMDAIRDRFGTEAIIRARLAKRRKEKENE